MTWMASLMSAAGSAAAPEGRPPSSTSVEAMNAGDWPNRFSKLFCDMSEERSSSSYPSNPSSISSSSNPRWCFRYPFFPTPIDPPPSLSFLLPRFL
uniref:Cesa10 n=1 Tax=Arundo donax TaxID=35708 RepID=A0A0A9E4P9_ARUDO